MKNCLKSAISHDWPVFATYGDSVVKYISIYHTKTYILGTGSDWQKSFRFNLYDAVRETRNRKVQFTLTNWYSFVWRISIRKFIVRLNLSIWFSLKIFFLKNYFKFILKSKYRVGQYIDHQIDFRSRVQNLHNADT